MNNIKDKLINLSQTFYAIIVFLFFFITIAIAYFRFDSNQIGEARNPASFKTSNEIQRITLDENWMLAFVETDYLNPSDIINEKNIKWFNYNIKKNNIDTDKFKGHYLLKKEIFFDKNFNYPGMLLGIISHYHKVFLNNYFIGGSDFYTYVAHYPFDSKIIKPNEKNVLIVKGFTHKTSDPGVRLIPHLGSFIGEFSDVHREALSDTINFHFKRTVYLIVAFILFLICFTYFLFHQKKIFYFYFSLYLLLGCVALLYYNFFVSNSLSHQLYRFIKLFSLFFSSSVLCSSYLALLNKRKLTLINNIFGIIIFVTMSLSLLAANLPVSSYMKRYNHFFIIGFYYSLIWISCGTIHYAYSLIKKMKYHFYENQFLMHGYRSAVLLSSFFTCLIIYSSILTSETTPLIKGAMAYLGITYPFIFSLFLISLITLEHIINSKIIIFEKSRSDLTGIITKLLYNSDNFEHNITLVQEKICGFLESERSTIYLREEEKENVFFKARYFYGQKEDIRFVKKIISPDEGIIGISNAKQKPLLIKDINREIKINSDNNEKESTKNYKTKSCMIFPLLFKSQTIGFITLADKKNSRCFTQTDFEIMNKAIGPLAILINSSKLKLKYESQLKGIIEALSRMIGEKDPYTTFHSGGVAYIAEKIAERYGIKFTEELKIAALLHDVGKVFIPKHILNKPTKLNKKEKEAIEKHPKLTESILNEIPGFENIAKWAGSHHETIDGKGYPCGLTEDLIPIEGQLIGVSDFIDALCTNRAYRQRFCFNETKELLLDMSAKNKFSRSIVKAALEVIDEDDFRKQYSEKGVQFKNISNTHEAIFKSYSTPLVKILATWNEFHEFLTTGSRKIEEYELRQAITLLDEIEKTLFKIKEEMQKPINSCSNF